MCPTFQPEERKGQELTREQRHGQEDIRLSARSPEQNITRSEVLIVMLLRFRSPGMRSCCHLTVTHLGRPESSEVVLLCCPDHSKHKVATESSALSDANCMQCLVTFRHKRIRCTIALSLQTASERYVGMAIICMITITVSIWIYAGSI